MPKKGKRLDRRVHEPAGPRIERRFAAPPERVFAAWTDPALAGRWLFRGGPTSERGSTELDPRPGGRWTITDRREGTDDTASGEYLEVEPPRRLVFTFAMLQFSANSDTITVELVADGDGTLMTFTQAGPDIADEVRQTAAGEEPGSATGWGWMFIGLDNVLADAADAERT